MYACCLRSTPSIGIPSSTYLSRNIPHLLPHKPRQYILQKRQIDLRLHDFQLGLARVQGKRGRRRLAGLDGAGEEVEREELHFCGVLFSLSGIGTAGNWGLIGVCVFLGSREAVVGGLWCGGMTGERLVYG